MVVRALSHPALAKYSTVGHPFLGGSADIKVRFPPFAHSQSSGGRAEPPNKDGVQGTDGVGGFAAQA